MQPAAGATGRRCRSRDRQPEADGDVSFRLRREKGLRVLARRGLLRVRQRRCSMETGLRDILEQVRQGRGRVVALTGAGISAESGIPTFRGSEGFWVVGSQNYMPQEMATMEMFR